MKTNKNNQQNIEHVTIERDETITVYLDLYQKKDMSIIDSCFGCSTNINEINIPTALNIISANIDFYTKDDISTPIKTDTLLQTAITDSNGVNIGIKLSYRIDTEMPELDEDTDYLIVMTYNEDITGKSKSKLLLTITSMEFPVIKKSC